jgi:hypothetical protein
MFETVLSFLFYLDAWEPRQIQIKALLVYKDIKNYKSGLPICLNTVINNWNTHHFM